MIYTKRELPAVFTYRERFKLRKNSILWELYNQKKEQPEMFQLPEWKSLKEA